MNAVTETVSDVKMNGRNKRIGWKELPAVLLTLLSLFICYMQIELSIYDPAVIFSRTFGVTVLSMACIGTLLLAIWAMTRSRGTAVLVTAALCFLFASANFYVILYHGAPFMVSDLRNIGTAANVLGTYKLTIPGRMWVIILLSAVNIGLGLVIHALDRSAGVRLWPRLPAAAAVLAVFLCFGFLGENPIKPAKAQGYSFDAAAEQYGYLLIFGENAIRASSAYSEPEGCSPMAAAAALKSMPAKEAAGDSRRPDIFLILNETFYDPALYLDITADVPYLDKFYACDNAVHGYMAAPWMNTNNSEYELLTGNSTALLNGSAPFNYLDMSGANSIVSYVEALGYETCAMHLMPGSNYSRDRGYPALGFDHIYFEQDVEWFYDRYGNRGHTDTEHYVHLMEAYESCGEGPRFMYLLTMQNHGGWEVNEPEDDLVHAFGDFGEYADDMDEYLTGIYLSQEAFLSLQEYFSASPRDVVIAMVGDHSPSFPSELTPKPGLDEQEALIASTLTPFIIWANFDIEDADMGNTGLIDMFPLLMKTAGLPLSPYLQYMLSLQEKVPLLSAYGIVSDTTGRLLQTGESPELEAINGYFALEYANLSREPELAEAFLP